MKIDCRECKRPREKIVTKNLMNRSRELKNAKMKGIVMSASIFGKRVLRVTGKQVAFFIMLVDGNWISA